VAANFANAQDVTFLLLWAALAVVLVRGGADFAAGLVLALCAQKFHLLVFLPVLIVAARRWRLGAGLVAGSAVLLALSFAAGPIIGFHVYVQDYLLALPLILLLFSRLAADGTPKRGYNGNWLTSSGKAL
jgi:hypothetical protein